MCLLLYLEKLGDTGTLLIPLTRVPDMLKWAVSKINLNAIRHEKRVLTLPEESIKKAMILEAALFTQYS